MQAAVADVQQLAGGSHRCEGSMQETFADMQQLASGSCTYAGSRQHADGLNCSGGSSSGGPEAALCDTQWQQMG